MDHEIFDGIYFSNVKFSKLIKSKKSIPEIIEIIKYKVKNLDIKQCTTDNLFLIKQNHQFLIEKGFEKEQSIRGFFEKLIVWSWGAIVCIIGCYNTYIYNYLGLVIEDAEKMKKIKPALSEYVDSIAEHIVWYIVIVLVVYLIIFICDSFLARQKERQKEKMRIAYSILEKHFERKIKSIKSIKSIKR